MNWLLYCKLLVLRVYLISRAYLSVLIREDKHSRLYLKENHIIYIYIMDRIIYFRNSIAILRYLK